MELDTKKEPTDRPKPYSLDELTLDGNLDRERLLATLDAKYQEELEKKAAKDGD